MTVVSLELRARYGAWFRRAGDLVAAGDSLIPLESLLSRWHPGRVRQLLRRRQFDGKSKRQAQNIG